MFVLYSVSYFIRFTTFIMLLFGCCTQGARFRINPNCNQPRGDFCTVIHNCPYFATLLKSHTPPLPRSLIDVIRKKQCGFHGSNPKVCCDHEISTDENEQPNESIDFGQIKDHPNLHLLPNDDCGKISIKFRITHGDETELLEFPWMALLTFYSKGKIEFKCGGTIINTWYILTAAHCASGADLIGIRLGEHDLKTKVDCNQINDYCSPPVQDFFIQSITIHPNYTANNRLWLNDIALIQLAKPANFTYENVQPICLPIDEYTNVNLVGKYLTLSGWGVKENGQKSEVLQKVNIPVLPYQHCSELYKNYTVVTHKQICAGGEIGKDSCSGDSGGPLKYAISFDGSSRYVQYGIVSYGPTICGMKPAIYTNVIHYIEWILDTIKQ